MSTTETNHRRDGVWSVNGLSADFIHLYAHPNCADMHRIKTACGDHYAHTSELKFDGSPIHGAACHEPNKSNASMCNEIEKMQEVIRAAWRTKYYDYQPWETAGGVGECEHGIAAGIHCRHCDDALLRHAYDQMTAKNNYV